MKRDRIFERTATRASGFTFDGETFGWRKRTEWFRFLDLPQRTPQPFVMAMKPTAGEIDARVRAAGWELVDPEATSRDVAGYRRFIQESRGEFTIVVAPPADDAGVPNADEVDALLRRALSNSRHAALAKGRNVGDSSRGEP